MRDDISNKLIHFTKGASASDANPRETAAFNLLQIMSMQAFIGGDGYIKGKFKCVCFTETPLAKLTMVYANTNQTGYKYQPYGVMVEKKWLYDKGGRPVFYGPDEEYEALPEIFKYRHVRFDLNANPIIDFTWEREWRIRTNLLEFTPDDVTIILPDKGAISAFDEFSNGKWHYIVLSDLGVEVAVT